MPVARHTIPFLPGEDIMQPPGFDDPRMQEWCKLLVELGVMDENHISLKDNMRVRRGVCAKGFVYEIVWPED